MVTVAKSGRSMIPSLGVSSSVAVNVSLSGSTTLSSLIETVVHWRVTDGLNLNTALLTEP